MNCRLLLPVFTVLSACIPEFPKRDFIENPTTDHDGDGYSELEGDCDDDNALAFPGAEERCDGFDNDCDGDADEDDAVDAPTWYSDADRDGYGTNSFVVTACEAPSEAYSDTAGDCDDAVAAIHPGAMETCAPYDENCDGNINEGEDDGTLIDTDIWYKDGDNDGYGTDAETIQGCDRPEGYVLDAGDCDDTNRFRSPREPEVCDGFDNDCNNLTDDEDPAMTGEGTWYPDDDGDGFGNGDGVVVVQCAQPDGHVLDATDCDDTNPTANPAEVERCNTVDDNCNGVTDEFLTVTAYVDADGDGFGAAASDPIDVCTIGDGYASTATDCDDTKTFVNPDGVETCNEIDDNCDGRVDEGVTVFAYIDDDDDGHGALGTAPVEVCRIAEGLAATPTDCNDTSDAVFPGNPEICNGIDEDCDGVIDEGVSLSFYRDFDGDGFGDADSPTEACSVPDGYTVNWTDCDDTTATTYPGADEYCDGVNNDCDDFTDEDDAVDAPAWYQDADDDGYGNETSAVTACTGPVGYVATGGDCNDGRANVHPGIENETCFTAYDDNCNDDNNDVDAIGCITHYRDEDGDGHGVATDSVCVCGDREAYTTINTGDCDDSRANVNEDAWETCGTDYDDDCDGDDNDPNAIDCIPGFYDNDGDGYGTTDYDCRCSPRDPYNAPVPGDCNDDNADVHPDTEAGCGLFGEVTADQATATTGRSYVSDEDLRISGLGGFDGAGDVTADATDDLLVGNYDYDVPTPEGSINNAGAALIFAGPVEGALDLTSTSTAAAKITGTRADAWCGSQVEGLGDVSGDGYADVALLCPGEETAYIFHGPLEGDYTTDDADAWFPSASRLFVGGDLDGDGSPEIFGDTIWLEACLNFELEDDHSPLKADLETRSQCHSLRAYHANGTGALRDDGELLFSVWENIGVYYPDDVPGAGGNHFPAYGPLHGGWTYGDVDFLQRNSSFVMADFDGDGFDDVIMAHPPTDMVFVFNGVDADWPGAWEPIDSAWDSFMPSQGWAIEGDGLSRDDVTGRGLVIKASDDFDGDGYPEMVISSPMADAYDPMRGTSEQGGMVEIVHAPFEEWPTNLSAQARTRIVGDENDLWVGISFDTPGDINNDGDDDLIIMSTRNDQSHPTRIFYGQFDEGTIDFAEADAQLRSAFYDNTSWAYPDIFETLIDELHGGVAGVGDLNNDGYQDFGIYEYVRSHNLSIIRYRYKQQLSIFSGQNTE